MSTKNPPNFNILCTFFYGGGGSLDSLPYNYFCLSYILKLKFLKSPWKRFRTSSLYRAKWNYIYVELFISFLALLTNTVKTHHLPHLAVIPQLHDIYVDGGKDGDYESLILKLSSVKVFWFQMSFTNNTLCSRGPETAVLP